MKLIISTTDCGNSIGVDIEISSEEFMIADDESLAHRYVMPALEQIRQQAIETEIEKLAR